MEKIIEKFYTGFKNLDAESMISCYHDDVEFEYPAFGKLKGKHAKNMWYMLCENAKDLKVEFSSIKADEKNGSAHWEAHYKFSQTGNQVHNIIDATFEFKDGLISSVAYELLVSEINDIIGSDGNSLDQETDNAGSYNYKIKPITSYELVASLEGYLKKKKTMTTIGVEKNTDFVIDFELDPIVKEIIFYFLFDYFYLQMSF